MKDEREILTRQAVSKKLTYEAKRSIVGSLLTCVLAFILFGMLKLVLPSFTYAKNMMIVLVYVFPLPIYAGCAFYFIRGTINYININKGAFSVVEDELVEIKDNELSLFHLLMSEGRGILAGQRNHLVHVFKFKSGKKYVVNAEEYKHTKLDAVAQFSNPGDSFYVVFYNHSPNKIILIFSAKTHTYKDN